MLSTSTNAEQPGGGANKDIVIVDLAASPTTVAAGNSVTVSWNVKNEGTTTVTETYSEKVYLSADQNRDGSDTQLGSSHTHIAPLESGWMHFGSVQVTIPGGTVAGTWYLLVQGDAGGSVAEGNENNNVTATPITVQQNQSPTINSLTANPTTVAPGGTSTISVSASDPENDPLSYSWSASGGSLSTSSGPGPVTWTAPSSSGTYTVTVSVTDNKAGHSPVSQSVSITVTPSLTITSGSSGSGNGTVSYSVTANTGTSSRTGTLTIAGQTFTVTQAGNQLPVAQFTMTSGSQSAQQNQTLTLTVSPGGTASVTFSAANSFDPDGSITAYRWQINGTQVSTSSSFSFSLGKGTHSIFLTVTDNLGAITSVGGYGGGE